MTEQWVDFAVQISGIILGGALVILANYITHRGERRREAEERASRNSALMTALFMVRNFLVEELNGFQESRTPRRSVGVYRTALSSLQSIIDKSPPETQYVIASVYEIGLRLSDLVAALEGTKVPRSELSVKADRLYQALEMFDIVAGQDLSILGSDELREIVTNPEDVPD